MAQGRTIPDINIFVAPLLGTSYDTWDCWDLVRHLYLEGLGLDIAREGDSAANRFQEVWYVGSGEPFLVMQPWDLALFTNNDEFPFGQHVGIIMDPQTFVHARRSETGVAIGRLRSWKPRLIQLSRLRELL